MSDDEAQARLDNYLSHMLEAAQMRGMHNRMVHAVARCNQHTIRGPRNALPCTP